ncbi:MAG: hypothetical protein APF76_12240 [Desulfitibacter sp. BRH_c19]|nr:MAG: hypothetical protein APF76_12240 [Desulfitibacter sp. BRH_c19]
MLDDMKLYDNFVDASPQGSLFHKSWWLDAVAPDKYKIVYIKEKDNILAAWPLVQRKIMKISMILEPQLTPILGIMFAPSSKSKYSESLSEEIRLITKLIDILPKHSYFYQRFHREFTNWLPLYWANFKQTTRYTYLIDNLSNLDLVWENIRSNTKRKIRKALRQGIKVVTNVALEEFLKINEMSYKRQGLVVPYSKEYVKAIDAACQKNNARKIFFAIDSEYKLHAAVYIVYDNRVSYYLMGGADPDLRASDAHYLALWEAIKFASTVSQSFDFEGSMHSNIEPVFRGFGGVQASYMEITRGNCFLHSTFTALRYAWSRGGIPSLICSKLIN